MQIHYLQLNWEVVQLVEHWSPKPAVVGSIPTFSAILGCISSVLYTVERVIGCMWVQAPLPVLSWSTRVANGTDCKSDDSWVQIPPPSL